MKKLLITTLVMVMALIFFTIGKGVDTSSDIQEIETIEFENKNIESNVDATTHEADHIIEDSHGQNDIKAEVKNIKEYIIDIEQNEETDSLKSTIGLIDNIEFDKVDLEILSEQLKDAGINTEVSKDENPYTGKMYIIKSNKSVPGIRYFHTQIFESDDTKFIQHMSFEYRKGENSFKEAITLVNQKIGNKAKFEILNDNYALLRRSDNRIVTIKKLNLSDIESDIINPHDNNDIGTIRITIEQEIH